MFFFILGFVLWFLFFVDGMAISPGVPRLLASAGGWILILLVSISALPITMSLAILRYRLWGIVLVLRRTIQFSLLTAIMLLVYFFCVVILQALIAAVGGYQSSIAVVLSTLAIAALFNPQRNRLQTFIDHRFYRPKYDAEHALAQFALKARDEMDMDKLTFALVNLTRETMHPEIQSLWLMKTNNSGISIDEFGS